MTGEELTREMKEVRENLQALADAEKPLSKSDEKKRRELNMRQKVLEKIARAQQQQHPRDEMYHSIVYGMLKSGWATRHPFLASMMMGKFRESIDIGM